MIHQDKINRIKNTILKSTCVMKRKGKTINKYWNIEFKNGRWIIVNNTTGINPLAACLFHKQPTAPNGVYNSSPRWDHLEIRTLANFFDIQDDFIDALHMGYDEPTLSMEQYIAKHLDANKRMPENAVVNVILNQDEFKQGTVLGSELKYIIHSNNDYNWSNFDWTTTTGSFTTRSYYSLRNTGDLLYADNNANTNYLRTFRIDTQGLRVDNAAINANNGNYNIAVDVADVQANMAIVEQD